MPPRISWTDSQLAEIRKMIEVECLTQAVAAKRLGIHEATLGRLCSRLGLKTQRTGPRSGHGHPNWIGGKIRDKHGYVLVYAPDHPNARRCEKGRRKYVLEHRLVMSQHLGRPLSRHEVVHHKNDDKQDNRIENLELFESNGAHIAKTLVGKPHKMSPAGREAIRQAQTMRHSRNRQARDAMRNNQTTCHSTT